MVDVAYHNHGDVAVSVQSYTFKNDIGCELKSDYIVIAGSDGNFVKIWFDSLEIMAGFAKDVSEQVEALLKAKKDEEDFSVEVKE